MERESPGHELMMMILRGREVCNKQLRCLSPLRAHRTHQTQRERERERAQSLSQRLQPGGRGACNKQLRCLSPGNQVRLSLG